MAILTFKLWNFATGVTLNYPVWDLSPLVKEFLHSNYKINWLLALKPLEENLKTKQLLKG